MRETADAINQRAVEWVARLDRDDADEAVRAEFEAWLAGDSRRRGAYLRAEVAWRMLDRASQLSAGERGEPSADSGGEPVETAFAPAKETSRRRFLIAGAGALMASLMGLALPFMNHERYRTRIGEVRRVPFADGSLAAINTQSEVAVALTDDRREVRLERGEAWFQVASDRDRPFLVSVGDVRVQAVGTAFAVRRRDSAVEVQVTEGVVETWSVREPERRLRLAAGARTIVAESGEPIQPPVEALLDIERRLSWRAGQLVFEGDTLGEAAAEFNRYNLRQIVIADPDLAQEGLVGRFRTNEPDSFAHAVALTLNARVTMEGREIRIARR